MDDDSDEITDVFELTEIFFLLVTRSKGSFLIIYCLKEDSCEQNF